MEITSPQAKLKHPKVLIFEDGGHFEKTLHGLNNLRKSKELCDVVLQVGAGQDIREIHAHRAVLAIASSFMFDLFSNDMKNGHKSQYKLNGQFDCDAFENLVEYAYTGRLEIPIEKLKDVYLVANRLKMYAAAKHCAKFLMDMLTSKNCIGMRSLTGLHNYCDVITKVDAFVKNHISEIIGDKEFLALPQIKVELLQTSSEEVESTNEKHLFDMIVDWLKNFFDNDDIDMDLLTEKVHMVYLNTDHTLHDCNDIENGTSLDTDMIQDYKKASKRGKPSKLNRKKQPLPSSKPRNFLYTRSESSSSLSSVEDDENEWKIIATQSRKERASVGLAIVYGRLCAISVVQRLNSPYNSPDPSRNGSVEKPDCYYLISPMNSARCAAGASEFNGKLLVCGGYDRGECLKTVEMYDHTTNKWTIINSMKVARGRFSIGILGSKTYAVGGSDGTNELCSVEVMDSDMKRWEKAPDLPQVRSNAGVCTLNEKVYVIGGWNGHRGITKCDVLDPVTSSWNPVKSLTVACYQAGVAAMNGEIYVVGGCDTWNCLNRVEKYNPDTDAWEMMAPLHTARRGCGVAAYNGKLYAVAGHDGVKSLSTVEIFDAETNTWSGGPSLTTCRANVAVTVVGDRLYAIGGFTGKTFLNTVEYLDSQTNKWTTFVAKDSLIQNCSLNQHVPESESNGHHSA